MLFVGHYRIDFRVPERAVNDGKHKEHGEGNEVRISKELKKRYQLYADVTGTSVEDVIQHALDEWMNVFGEAEIQVITGVVVDTDNLNPPITQEQATAPVEALPN